MKQVIRLNESDLHRMIKKSVRQVLNEDESFDYNGNKDKDDYKLIFSIRAWVRKIHTIVSGLENALQNGRLEDYETVRGFISQVVEKLRFVASNIEDDAIALKDNNNFEI
ncbi:MAG: hypothetical protein IJ352_07660 [Muribaculaceae bacterium]|nr:hypothetical protein [Muribaculaceae bacterium]